MLASYDSYPSPREARATDLNDQLDGWLQKIKASWPLITEFPSEITSIIDDVKEDINAEVESY